MKKLTKRELEAFENLWQPPFENQKNRHPVFEHIEALQNEISELKKEIENDKYYRLISFICGLQSREEDRIKKKNYTPRHDENWAHGYACGWVNGLETVLKEHKKLEEVYQVGN
jgi:hypothetical protein